MPISPSTALRLLPLWLAVFGSGGVGCGGGGESRVTLADVAVYQAVVRGELEGEEAAAACRGIQAEDPRGDCVVALVQRSAREQDAGASLCPDAPAGTWRDECWFVVAEGQRRAGRREVAARACLRAGAFADDCGQHLWQSEVRAAVLGRPGSGPPPAGSAPDFAEAAPRLQEIHARWAPLLSSGTDIDTRLYERAFANGFEASGFVDLARCAGLDAALEARCHAAGATIVSLRARAELPGSIRSLCGADLADPTLWGRLRSVDHPVLRQALVGLSEEAACTEKDRALGPGDAAEAGRR